MGKIDVIVVGSSAGGITALGQIIAGLPADFQAPVFIVQHLAADRPSELAGILDRAGPLPAIYPIDGSKITGGTIYIAPPDHHMLIEGDHILVKKGPKENRFRPSIDALFRSAAYTFGSGVVGVILTGMLDDGSSGMWSIKRMGGTTIIQDPLEALYPSMPSSVFQHVDVDHVCQVLEIPQLLNDLDKTNVRRNADVSEKEVKLLKMEVDIVALGNAFDKGITEMGEPSSLTCPECGGALTSLKEGHSIRYRCHTGHAYSSASLLAEVSVTVEGKLWQSLRSVEEAVMIVEKEFGALYPGSDNQLAIRYSAKIQALKNRATELHNFIQHYLEFNKLMTTETD
jgi:two-component system chemotaxis response regulator CheB